MSQLTLFTTANETPVERKIKRERHTFGPYADAVKFAQECIESGNYSEVDIVMISNLPNVITEREEW